MEIFLTRYRELNYKIYIEIAINVQKWKLLKGEVKITPEK